MWSWSLTFRKALGRKTGSTAETNRPWSSPHSRPRQWPGLDWYWQIQAAPRICRQHFIIWLISTNSRSSLFFQSYRGFFSPCVILKRFLNQTPYHKAPIFNLLFKGDRHLKKMRPGYFAALRFIKSNVFNNSLQCRVFTKLWNNSNVFNVESLSHQALGFRGGGEGGALCCGASCIVCLDHLWPV